MNVFKRVLVVSLFGLATLYAGNPKVVYDLTTGDAEKIEKYLINSIDGVAKHYKKENKELKVIVVISGDAYKYFVNDLKASPYASDKDALKVKEKFSHRLQNLNDTYGVTFNMCSSGMKAKKIAKSTLYKYVHADAMKCIYLIEAQNNGYAYMPIH